MVGPGTARALRAHGVEIEPFGRDFFRIEGVPSFLAPADADDFVRDILGLLRGGQSAGRGTAMSDEELARAAASRAAAAAAGPMPVAALDALVVDLLRCHTPHTSPAGRPVMAREWLPASRSW